MRIRCGRRRFRTLRWWQQIGCLILLLALAPLPFILLLGVFDPPVTMVMLTRVGENVAAGRRPVWPVHTPVSRNELSPNLRRAVLASEDDRFYLHHGIDFVELKKALEARRSGGRLRGASTLTQQVAKNTFLWNGRSFVRKALEAYVALWMDMLLGKERILDLYLNMAEWGPDVFGAEAGARYHYGKSAASLTRDEAARMAAILPSPRRWTVNGRTALNRSVAILGRMRYPAPKLSSPSPAAPIR